MKVLTKPTIRFSQKAYQQMWALTDECDIEISAIGIVASPEEMQELGLAEDYYVKEFFVPKQTCTGVSTVMDEDDLLEIMMGLRERGVKAVHACVWWHSHVNMGTGHSGTDENQIERFDFDEVCISIITNKKRELNLRVDMFSPFRYSFEACPYTVDQISILPDGWAKEMVTDRVSRPVVKPEKLVVTKGAGKSRSGGTSWGRNYYQGYHRGWNSMHGWDDDDEDLTAGVVTTSLVEDTPPVAEEVIECLDFPQELSCLQSAYDVEEIGANDAMRLYAKWFAKEISTEEVNQELEEVYGVTEAPGEEEEEDLVGIYTVNGSILQEEDFSEEGELVVGGAK
jgi:hypothetical protein